MKSLPFAYAGRSFLRCCLRPLRVLLSWGGVMNFFTVSFHNFKSQNFKLSVSNPKSKYVAYVSVVSRISNCQSLGRKSKHDISKTDPRAASDHWHRGRGKHPRGPPRMDFAAVDPVFRQFDTVL